MPWHMDWIEDRYRGAQELSHDLQQIPSGIFDTITGSVSGGVGGVGDWILDAGAGVTNFFTQETEKVWTEPIEDITKSWPLALAVAAIGYAMVTKKGRGKRYRLKEY